MSLPAYTEFGNKTYSISRKRVMDNNKDESRMSERFSWAWSQKLGSSSRKNVLVALAHHANKDLLAWPSMDRLVECTELNAKTITEVIRDLKRFGLISDTGERAGRSGQIPVFKLHTDLVVHAESIKKCNAANLVTAPILDESIENERPPIIPERPPIIPERPPIIPEKTSNIGARNLYRTSKEPLKNLQSTEDLQLAAQAAPQSTELVPAKPKKPKAEKTEQQQISSQVWEAYSAAYQVRYKAEPIRNAMVNKQISTLVGRLGAEAVQVAAWFVSHRYSYYVQKGHAIGALLADCEKLRTEWYTGQQMTAKTAQQIDGTQTNLNALDTFKAMVANKYGKEGAQ